MTQNLHIIRTQNPSLSSDDEDANNIGQWVRWVRHDQSGFGQDTDFPPGGTLQLDNDGEIKPKFRAICDISHGLSTVLGKQLPMTATYRVTGFHLGIRPVDDLLSDDNEADAAGQFGGSVRWITPTKHRVNAIKEARKVSKEMAIIDSKTATASNDQGENIGHKSWLDPSAGQADYKGFRFGYRTETDVIYPTRENFTGFGDAVESGYASYCLFSDDGALGIMQAYNTHIDGTGEEGRSRRLWANRIGAFTKTGIPFMVGWQNGENETPGNHDFNYQCPAGFHIDVLGGILVIDVDYSLVESTFLPDNDDDYYLEVAVEVAGWSEW